ncbi:MAG: ATP-binding protein [Bacteroidales bacterium]|nr:ATP-binding protein [Bacteroidales bacterium]
MLKSTILEVIDLQKERNEVAEPGISRELLSEISLTGGHIKIISGIRRCGKSTLMRQLIGEDSNCLFLNFEDPKLTGFDLKDFNRLDEIIKEQGLRNIYFDEIQIVPEWERYIRALHDEDYAVFLTGSNASMLSIELGTKLTGRYIPKELLPFSYREFLTFSNQVASADSAVDFLCRGGFPEYLKYGDEDILHQILYDIIYRDISVRYQVKRHETLKQLAIYLITNVSKTLSYNQLRKTFELGSATTAIDFLSYFQNSYLLFAIPLFDFSLKKQIYNPKKVYAIDTGLAGANSLSFSKDTGRKLENAVFLHLRRDHDRIFYFGASGECDFVVQDEGPVFRCFQVCSRLDEENLTREIKGITEAMNYTGTSSGNIITLDQEDEFEKDGLVIHAIPFWKWAGTE